MSYVPCTRPSSSEPMCSPALGTHRQHTIEPLSAEGDQARLLHRSILGSASLALYLRPHIRDFLKALYFSKHSMEVSNMIPGSSNPQLLFMNNPSDARSACLLAFTRHIEGLTHSECARLCGFRIRQDQDVYN
jgi:hypothetical protein